MARHKKKVMLENIDCREYGYYSTPEFIATYIYDKMKEINPNGINLLDPAIGKEELTSNILDKEITGIDIIKFKNEYKCNFINQDFFEIYKEYLNKNIEMNYDYIILNPPYNDHEVNYIKKNKKELKKIFKDVGIHNTYSMYLSACIDISSVGTIIGIITLDSFMFTKNHKELRKKILENCRIHEITLCPTDLFSHVNADVRTCIMILEQIEKRDIKNFSIFDDEVIINKRPKNTNELKENMKKNNKNNKNNLKNIVLYKNDYEFLVDIDSEILKIFDNNKLGELFPSITGISTGNDKKYISKIKDDVYNIPFYKNPGNNKYYTENYLYIHKDFLEISESISNFMVRNKSKLYKKGIVCSSVGVMFSACYFPENSTFGINPTIICDEENIWWLMAYLNSNLVLYLLRNVIIRSNIITSGYLNKLPIIDIKESDKIRLERLSKEIYSLKKIYEDTKQIEKEINKIIFDNTKLSENIIKEINKFCENPILLT